ncbi:hypothetical protein CEXT_2371 [Caerostris extrusa]|uniref:Uncharacterized protein n=1 Tax=Caerostris extrusa TaxID=172846 RepID=A0AAV4Y168_CAEEX|nr:hypothetical protein CEXT_2371 [Caerostris extrusa]
MILYCHHYKYHLFRTWYHRASNVIIFLPHNFRSPDIGPPNLEICVLPAQLRDTRRVLMVQKGALEEMKEKKTEESFLGVCINDAAMR